MSPEPAPHHPDPSFGKDPHLPPADLPSSVEQETAVVKGLFARFGGTPSADDVVRSAAESIRAFDPSPREWQRIGKALLLSERAVDRDPRPKSAPVLSALIRPCTSKPLLDAAIEFIQASRDRGRTVERSCEEAAVLLRSLKSCGEAPLIMQAASAIRRSSHKGDSEIWKASLSLRGKSAFENLRYFAELFCDGTEEQKSLKAINRFGQQQERQLLLGRYAAASYLGRAAESGEAGRLRSLSEQTKDYEFAMLMIEQSSSEKQQGLLSAVVAAKEREISPRVFLCGLIRDVYGSTRDADRFEPFASAVLDFAERLSTSEQGLTGNSLVGRVASSLSALQHGLGSNTGRFLRDEIAFRKITLLLAGSFSPHLSFSSREELGKAGRSIRNQLLLRKVVYTDGGAKPQHIFITSVRADHPPFASSFDRDTGRSDPRTTAHHRRQIERFRGIFDISYGFKALTYACRSIPQDRGWLLGEMAESLSRGHHYLNSRSWQEFPGKGIILKGLHVPKILGISDQLAATTRSDEYSEWMEMLPNLAPEDHHQTNGHVHPFRSAEGTEFLISRGLIGVSEPDLESFQFEGINLSFLAVSHVFDAAGTAHAFLYPTELLHDLLARDEPLGDESFSPRALLQHAEKEGLGAYVVDVGNGSCFTGGFCNGLPASHELWREGNRIAHSRYSAPQYRGWPTADAFGKIHKWFFQDRGSNRVVYGMRLADEQLDGIVAGSLARIDLLRFAESQFSKGYTEPDDPDSRYRILDQAVGWARARNDGRAPKSESPSLILQPTFEWASTVDTPIVLDTGRGILWSATDEPYVIDLEPGSEANREAWDKLVVEHYDPESGGEFWLTPRLVHPSLYRNRLEAIRSKWQDSSKE